MTSSPPEPVQPLTVPAGAPLVEPPTTIPRPAEEQQVFRAAPAEVIGAERRGFDIASTLGGALAALGLLLLLSAIVGGIVGDIGYQRGVDGRSLSVGGLIAGLVVLLIACLVGGWVAGRMARRRGGLHGLVAVLWLILLAAALAVLAAVANDDLNVQSKVGLPDWFSNDAVTTTAIITGVIAVVLMLVGGFLGGRWGARHHATDTVAVTETRRRVREHPGGIVGGRRA